MKLFDSLSFKKFTLALLDVKKGDQTPTVSNKVGHYDTKQMEIDHNNNSHVNITDVDVLDPEGHEDDDKNGEKIVFQLTYCQLSKIIYKLGLFHISQKLAFI